MPPYRYRIALRLRHPSVTSSAICAALLPLKPTYPPQDIGAPRTAGCSAGSGSLCRWTSTSAPSESERFYSKIAFVTVICCRFLSLWMSLRAEWRIPLPQARTVRGD